MTFMHCIRWRPQCTSLLRHHRKHRATSKTKRETRLTHFSTFYVLSSWGSFALSQVSNFSTVLSHVCRNRSILVFIIVCASRMNCITSVCLYLQCLNSARCVNLKSIYKAGTVCTSVYLYRSSVSIFCIQQCVCVCVCACVCVCVCASLVFLLTQLFEWSRDQSTES